MSRSRVLCCLVAVVVLLAWWQWPSQDAGKSLETMDRPPLTDRVWIDHIPSNERDKIEVFVMLQEPAIGAFSRSSAYEGEWTSFEWDASSGMRFHMLQEQKSYKVSASIMSGDRCAPFDYCLRLKGAPRASKRYFSMKDWVINSEQDEIDVQSLLQSLSFPTATAPH